MRRAILAIVTVAATSALAAAALLTNAGAAGYKRDLLDAVHAATRIVVVEHSYKYDLMDDSTDETLVPDTIVYAERTLTGEETRQLVATVEGLADVTQDAFPACVFEPHHSLQFYVGDQLDSTMEICFRCSQVKWSGTRNTPPWALYGGLRSYIEAIGLHPELDWPSLAREHSKK